MPTVIIDAKLDARGIKRLIDEAVDGLSTFEKKCATCPVQITVDQGTEWKTQCVDCFKDERTKRECKLCKKKKICITEPSYKDVCGLCYREAPMKPCSKCKQYVIKAFEWRSMCSPCFKAADFDRPCQTCKVRPIQSHLPSYVTSCTRCYLEKKQLTHDACPWCPKDPDTKRLTLNKRKGAPGCRNCMIEKGLINYGDLPPPPPLVRQSGVSLELPGDKVGEYAKSEFISHKDLKCVAPFSLKLPESKFMGFEDLTCIRPGETVHFPRQKNEFTSTPAHLY